MKPEHYLRDFLWNKEIISIWPVKKKNTRTEKYKLVEKEFAPATFTHFKNELGLFGKITVGTKSRPKRFDFVAIPIDNPTELVIIELKVKKEGLSPADFLQLLGYVNYFKYLQHYRGEKGREMLSQHIRGIDIKKETKIKGILIGRRYNVQLVKGLYPELEDILKICTFKVTEGKFPNNIQKLLIHDRSFETIQQIKKEGKDFRKSYYV